MTKAIILLATISFLSSCRAEMKTLNYNAISCSCPQWSESKYNDNPDKREYIYLERANINLTNADSLWQGNNFPLRIKVRGHFLTEAGYPTGFSISKEKPQPGKVF